MATKRKRNRKKKNIRLLITFISTLTIVLLVGLLALFLNHHFARTNELREHSDNMANFLAELNSPNEPVSASELTESVNEEADEPADLPIPARYVNVLNDPEYMRENRIYAKDAIVPGEARLLFAGDILFDSYYAVMANAIKRGDTVDAAFCPDTLKIMRDADVMMLNNEFTYTTRGTPFPEKLYTFRAKPEKADWLNDMGVNLVSLANNHTFDYGEISLLDTLDTLSAYGVPYVGAGRNIDEAKAPVYFIISDIKIAFVAATQIERMSNPDTRGATETLPGVFRFLNNERLLDTVAEAKENSDFVVVFLHWGSERAEEPDWSQLEQSMKIAAAGADLIVGAHPHVLQEISAHGNTPVAYSLGDFWFSSRTVDTGLLEAIFDVNGLKSLRFIPAIQHNCVTSLLHDGEKERVLNIMRDLSPRVNIDDDGVITW
ncbi:MAG: CapA family protein [Lachnospiraceae bacterium]|nr:CapA family protein [Lachnospiraceae bacterium]